MILSSSIKEIALRSLSLLNKFAQQKSIKIQLHHAECVHLICQAAENALMAQFALAAQICTILTQETTNALFALTLSLPAPRASVQLLA